MKVVRIEEIFSSNYKTVSQIHHELQESLDPNARLVSTFSKEWSSQDFYAVNSSNYPPLFPSIPPMSYSVYVLVFYATIPTSNLPLTSNLNGKSEWRHLADELASLDSPGLQRLDLFGFLLLLPAPVDNHQQHFAYLCSFFVRCKGFSKKAKYFHIEVHSIGWQLRP